MNKSFEDKIKGKMDSLDLSANAENWTAIEQKMTGTFEQKISHKLSGVQTTVPAYLWDSIDTALSPSMASQVKAKVAEAAIPQASPAVWAGIASRVESMPGTFETGMKKVFATHNVPVAPHLFDGISQSLDRQKTGRNWKKYLSYAAAIALIFILPVANMELDAPHSLVSDAGDTNAPSSDYFDSKTGTDYIAEEQGQNSRNTDRNKLDSKESEAMASIGGWKNGGNDATKSYLNSDPSSTQQGTTLRRQESNGSETGFSSQVPSSVLTQNSRNSAGQSGVQNPLSVKNDLGKAQNNGGGADGNKGQQASNLQKGETPHRGLSNAVIQGKRVLANLDDFEINKLTTGESTINRLKGIASPILDVEKINRIKNGFSVALAAAGGYFSMRHHNANSLANYNNDFMGFQSDLAQNGRFVSVGVELSKKISEKVSFHTGAEITLAMEDLTFSRQGDASLSENLKAGSNSFSNKNAVVGFSFEANILSFEDASRNYSMAYTGDSIVTGGMLKLTSDYYFVDIPLALSVESNDRKKFKFSMMLGAKLRMVSTANSFHVSSNRREIVEVNSDETNSFYQASLAGFARGSIHKKVSRGGELFCGPEVTINANEINKSGTWVSMLPFQLGLKLGFKQKFR